MTIGDIAHLYDDGSPRADEPVAIIGIGCRMPGGADSADNLWRLLIEKRDPVQEGPFDRWDVDAFYDPDRETPGRSNTRWAATLDDVTGFDAAFFGISPAEAASLDPQHRLLLEVCWESLEHAGIPPRDTAGTRGGVFVGIWSQDNAVRLGAHYRSIDAYAATIGNTHSTAAGRISYTLGLHGPAVALDTACSSSLVATHLAVQSLRSGESDFALAGGVNIMLSPEFMLSGTRWGMFSPTGRCHAFDSRADGLVRSEGAGIVVLKRLADAERAGDEILAVIRGSAINQDGRSQGLVHPSEEAQRMVYTAAVAQAGIDPGLVGLVETHGPGTPVGDPIEFRALAPVYGTGAGRCALGSVKSNIGHLESASGIAGLIKTVLSLRHGVIPPNLHFREWNPNISPENTRFFVPTEPTSWPVDGPVRVAAVSSFGFSGTNAHLVVEQYNAAPPATPVSHRPYLVPLSTTAPHTVRTAATRLAEWLTERRGRIELADIAHTLAARRTHHRTRRAVVAASVDELIEGLHRIAADEPDDGSPGRPVRDTAGVVWVFSGQGSQWAGMGRHLLEEEPVFAAAIAELEPLIAAEAGFSVTETLRAPVMVAQIERIQICLFATQVALAAVWRSLGVRPAAVLGHSMGEVAAAVVGGALTVADGVRVSCRRAATLVPLSGTGAMASVDLPYDRVEAEIRDIDDVTVAVISAPSSTVIAGGPEPVRQLVEYWRARDVPVRPVASDVAAHGPHLDPHAPLLIEALADIRPHQPSVPFYSTVSENPRDEIRCDGAYWADNLRKPVRFADAIRAAAADGHTVFLEVSVHPIVGHAMQETLREVAADTVVVHTIRRDNDDLRTIAGQLAQLHLAGVPIDFRRSQPGALVAAPATTWHRTRHWIDLPLAHPGREGTSAIRPPLLGTRTEVPEPGRRQLWHTDIGTATHPWLADHRVDGVAVLPAAAYCETALAAGTEFFATTSDQLRLTDLRFLRLLALDEHTVLTTSLVPRGHDTAVIEMFSRDDADEWTVHATATVVRHPRRDDCGPADRTSGIDPGGDTVDIAALYAGFRSDGYDYGPAFAAIDTARRVGADTVARIGVPAPARGLADPIGLHPVLFDGCLQALLLAAVSATAGAGRRMLFPVEVGWLRVLVPGVVAGDCRAVLTSATDDGATGAVQLVDDDGTLLAEAGDIRFAPLPRRQEESGHERLFHEIRWRESPLEQTPPARGTWLILGDGTDPLPAALHAELAAHVPATLLRTEDHAQPGQADPPTLPTATDVVVVPARAATGEPTDRCRDGALQLVALTELLSRSATPAPRLWIVTQGAHALAADTGPVLDYAGLRGIARVAMCEYPELRTTLVDVESGTIAVPDLVAEFFADRADDEIAWRDHGRAVARLVSDRFTDGTWDGRPHRRLRYGRDGIALRIARPGDLDTIGPVESPRRTPNRDEIEIHTIAIGLNFADVMHMLDMFPDLHGTSGELGLECSGIVTAVGAGVTRLRPGDRVMAFHDGAAGSFVTMPADSAVVVPPTLTDIEAAAVPAAHLTAWYALTRVAHLSAGERILIHSATGGVGSAAVAIARLLGAQVLATAGSAGKRAQLRALGIEHVMDSRSADFVAETLAATGGKGVDVVLNSLSGPLLFAGLEVLDLGGRFVEIGKRDVYADTKLGLLALRRNITVSTVDLALLERERRPLIRELLEELAEEFRRGRLDPPVCTEFAFTEATAALRQMAAAKHRGKLVLTVPRDGEVEVAIAPGTTPVVRTEAGYIVTGGLGGLGVEIAGWLAGQGAGRIVLNGRSAPSESVATRISRLRSGGTEIDVVHGDIAEPGVADKLVAAATAGARPLAGVIHAATVLDDGALAGLDADRFDRVWHPKVTGAWRLHEATVDHTLDWFVLFSSIAALLGSPGQGNYAAANDWLDSFARWRRARGLPALAVDWGVWGESGRAAHLENAGYAAFTTAAGLRSLEDLIDNGRTHAGVFVFDPEHWFHSTPKAADSPFFAELTSPVSAMAEQHTDTTIAARLAQAPVGDHQQLLLRHLDGCIRAVLGLTDTSVGGTTALSDLGFDSLTALQLRNRLENDLRIKLPATLVWIHATAGALAEYLLDRLDFGDVANAPAALPPAERDTAGLWFRFTKRPGAPMRLFCFPHAGGSASTYLAWHDLLPDHVELHAVQLPGRDDRGGEPPYTDVIALAEKLADLIADPSDARPFALFGHSGGSLLAFETARALRTRHELSPVALALSAVPAPDGPGMDALVRQVFRTPGPAALEALAFIPPDIRQEKELLDRATRALNDDYTMYRAYRYSERSGVLDCPLVLFSGDNDPLCHPDDLHGWERQSITTATTHIYSGDHFYLRDHLPAIIATLTSHLR
ncbi:SDR family NAD(P)-dependent oxidoreductase [Nocardia sp. NPDC050193]